MKKVYEINSAREMKKFGEKFAMSVCRNRKKTSTGALVVALEGELGAGKTQFAKGFAKGLGIKQRISSPTFVICRSYKIPCGKTNACPNFTDFYHIDLYRLQKLVDLDSLGLKKVLSGNNLVVIEWPALAKKIFPPATLWLNFKTIAQNTRQITMPAFDF